MLRFNKLVNGNALLAAGIFLFAMHELPKSVAINQGTLCGFLQAIQSGYECVWGQIRRGFLVANSCPRLPRPWQALQPVPQRHSRRRRHANHQCVPRITPD